MTEQQNQLDDALLPPAKVAEAYGVHEKTLPRLVREKRIPAPVERSHRYTRWSRLDVQQDLAARRQRARMEAST
jgi:predicted DNA-binding transcriptional regulator AlpA